MSTARQYELVYIVSPEASEQEVTDLHAQVEAITARLGGQVAKTENWGRRKLAYQIGRHKEGTYVLEVIDGSGDLMKELDRRLKVSEQVIRHLVVRVDEELRAAERLRAARRTDSLHQERLSAPEPPATEAAAGETPGTEDQAAGEDESEDQR
jgi:small subunit ribosomal protein S6